VGSVARIPIKEAVANAMEFAKGTLEPSRTRDLRLEEFKWEFRTEGEVFLVTLSMARPRMLEEEAINPMSLGSLAIGPRDYKVFTVRCDTGEVVAMEIRELSHTE
jgi:hypothetical protein